MEAPGAERTLNGKTHPPGSLGATAISPPWASTIVLQIDKPIPRPEGFVVKNASKTCSIRALSIPGPLSAMETQIFPSIREDRIVKTRGRSSDVRISISYGS